MWLLQIFKETFNSTFDYFLEKVKGRFLAFALQLIISYVAIALFTLLITAAMVVIMNAGAFSLDLFSMNGLFEWMRMIDPAWTVTIVIAVNYMVYADLSKKSMAFPDFYRQKSPKFWIDLLVALSILAVILIIYYKNELFLAFQPNPLEILLDEGFNGINSPLTDWLSNLIFYGIIALPIIIVVILEIRERKRNGFKLKRSLWKLIVAAVILSFVINWSFDNFLFMFGRLVMNLIYIPFQLMEIPSIFAGIVTVLFKTLNFMFLAAIIHFILKHSMETSTSTELKTASTNDLLDI